MWDKHWCLKYIHLDDIVLIFKNTFLVFERTETLIYFLVFERTETLIYYSAINAYNSLLASYIFLRKQKSKIEFLMFKYTYLNIPQSEFWVQRHLESFIADNRVSNDNLLWSTLQLDNRKFSLPPPAFSIS